MITLEILKIILHFVCILSITFRTYDINDHLQLYDKYNINRMGPTYH